MAIHPSRPSRASGPQIATKYNRSRYVKDSPFANTLPSLPEFDASKHDSLCIRNPAWAAFGKFCWCKCGQCWDKRASKCTCSQCKCRHS